MNVPLNCITSTTKMCLFFTSFISHGLKSDCSISRNEFYAVLKSQKAGTKDFFFTVYTMETWLPNM